MEPPTPEVFGPGWDTDDAPNWPRVQTPVREKCEGCGGGITHSARGVIAPEVDENGVRMARYHLRCFRKSGHPRAGDV